MPAKKDSKDGKKAKEGIPAVVKLDDLPVVPPPVFSSQTKSKSGNPFDDDDDDKDPWKGSDSKDPWRGSGIFAGKQWSKEFSAPIIMRKLSESEEEIIEILNRVAKLEEFYLMTQNHGNWQPAIVLSSHFPLPNQFTKNVSSVKRSTTSWMDSEWIIARCKDNPDMVGKVGKMVSYATSRRMATLEVYLEGDKRDGIPAEKIALEVQIGSWGEYGRQAIPLDPNFRWTATVMTASGQIMEVGLSLDVEQADRHVLPGRFFYVNMETKAIEYSCTIDPEDFFKKANFVRTKIREVFKNAAGYQFEIEGQRIVTVAPVVLMKEHVADASTIKVGDEVFVDVGGIHIWAHFPQKKSVTSTDGEITVVQMSEVAGLEEAKERILQGIIGPMKHKDIYQKYNMGKLPKGMLMYGPPGCGKTMLGRATVTALADAAGVSNLKESGFIYVKSTELLDSYVGESERNVRNLFIRAAKHFKENGYPAVIFVDEADEILKTRSGGNHGLQKNLVAPFLTEMDGLEEQSAFVILATNRHDVLDPAVTRNGRIDFKVRITRPTREAVEEIIFTQLSKRPVVLTEDYPTIQSLAKMTADALFDKTKVVTRADIGSAGASFQYDITLADCMNGAMAKNVVDEAVLKALHRDLSNGVSAVTGVTAEDLLSSVERAWHQTMTLPHNDVIWELREDLRDNPGKYNHKPAPVKQTVEQAVQSAAQKIESQGTSWVLAKPKNGKP